MPDEIRKKILLEGGRSIVNKVPDYRSQSQLTTYYKSLGVENPEMCAKLEILKQMSLIAVAQRFPEMKGMSTDVKKQVFSAAKTPLSIGDKLRRKAAYGKFFRLHQKH